MTAEEIQAEVLRLVEETDTILSTGTELTGNKRAQWGAYRQKLKDLLDSGTDPLQFVLPAPPF